MKQSPSLSQLGDVITHFVQRFHLVIFTLTVVIGVSVAVFLLNGLIEASNKTEPATHAMPTLDQNTIDRINSFKKASDGQDSFSLPPGRINPFVE